MMAGPLGMMRGPPGQQAVQCGVTCFAPGRATPAMGLQPAGTSAYPGRSMSAAPQRATTLPTPATVSPHAGVAPSSSAATFTSPAAWAGASSTPPVQAVAAAPAPAASQDGAYYRNVQPTPSRAGELEPWAVECSMRIALVGEEARFAGRARILDPQFIRSVRNGVDALNQGILHCSEDFCIVRAAAERAYYLTYRRGRRASAFAALGLSGGGVDLVNGSGPDVVQQQRAQRTCSPTPASRLSMFAAPSRRRPAAYAVASSSTAAAHRAQTPMRGSSAAAALAPAMSYTPPSQGAEEHPRYSSPPPCSGWNAYCFPSHVPGGGGGLASAAVAAGPAEGVSRVSLRPMSSVRAERAPPLWAAAHAATSSELPVPSPMPSPQRQRDTAKDEQRGPQPWMYSSPVEPAPNSKALEKNLTDMEKIAYSDLDFVENLGSGEFGQVFRGFYQNEEVAIKQLYWDDTMTENVMRDLAREIDSFRHLHHKRLVCFIGACLEVPHPCLVTEYMPGGSLHHLLHVRRLVLPMQHAMNMCLQLADAVMYLHMQVPIVVHHDLKSLNVVLDLNLNLKVCDFGLTESMERTHITKRNNGGSPRYMAPELFDSKTKITEKIDIWAMGCIFVEIFGGPLPYENINTLAELTREMLVHRRPPLVPSELPALLQKIFRSCVNFDHRLRPTSTQVFEQLKSARRQLKELGLLEK
eukprot:NODE_1403_length_2489_cov_5.317951.p1 GENE.NODE_1403_length_2489_cov_5.317951~~NODE_1403_length_2489_cov_5.317951.p1  ORF type:complete len:696 (+),score=137.60 NODE_1403_length_2489_cov_5.317951:142-2229(+)